VTEGAREQSRGVSGLSARAARLAWLLGALSLALTALSLLLLGLTLTHPNTHFYDFWLDCTVGAISFAPVGALIAARRPANPVGWLLCLSGVAISIAHFSAEYATYALLAQPDSLPAGQALAWIAYWILPIILGLLLFSFLLFPTGRLPSRRWKWLAWMAVAFVIVDVILSAFSVGVDAGLGPIRNPLGIEGFSNAYNVVVSISPVLYVAVASSLFVRLHRATGVERQQIKWVVYAVAATLMGTIVAYVIPEVIDTPLWFERVGFALNIAVSPAIPVAIAIAILRYRLYEIDTLINRTLVYGSLTAMLAAVYFGGVTVTQAILRALTGQQEQPQLAIVFSTLVIAALFNPLRHRIQGFIDRRFYRRKYDARKTLEAFSAQLRDETDLEALAGDLVGVVGETMQPAHVSLWLRPDTLPKAEQAD
jgi:hypothetical protein